MPAVTTTTRKVVETVQSAEFRARVAILLVKYAHGKYRKGDAESALATEVMRNPTRYVETIALGCAGVAQIQTAINEANDLERAFWVSDTFIEAVIAAAWPSLGGV